jgi:hypothetical protein
MPTAYTNFIKDKNCTFQKFALLCARNFGATISMRDESLSSPIPDKFEPSSYHKDRIKEIEKSIKNLKNTSNRELQKEIDQEYENATKYNKKIIEKCLKLKKRYENMLKQVEKWNPPSKNHQGLKDFMIQQITSSIEFDCDISYYENNIPIKLPLDLYKNKKFKELEKDYKYHMLKWEEEIKRVNDRNYWIFQLKESLGIKNLKK